MIFVDRYPLADGPKGPESNPSNLDACGQLFTFYETSAKSEKLIVVYKL
jgi:hypothetical protein